MDYGYILPENDVKLNSEIVTEEKRSEWPDDIFGIPELRKYPMPDEKHVRSAIKFFNYVDEEHEEELAKAIIKNMKKYNIDFSTVGEKNRLKKYLPKNINETVFLNHEDIYYNKDKFDSGEINLCFITGYSGSGKSTMASDLSNDKIESYEMDDVLWNHRFSDDDLKEYGDLIYKFFASVGSRFRNKTRAEFESTFSSWSDFEQCSILFVEFAKKYARQYKNRKIILNGVWVFYFIKPEQLKDYAVYVKGTSFMVSMKRAIKRDWNNSEKDIIYKSKKAMHHFTEELKSMKEATKKINNYITYFSNLKENSCMQESINMNKNNKLVPSNIKTHKVYMGSWINYDTFITKEFNDLWVTPYMGIASIFIKNDSIIRDEIYKQLGNISYSCNEAYDEWNLPEDKLKIPCKIVHMRLQGLPDFKQVSIMQHGYIYEIDTFKYSLMKYDWMDDTKEAIIHNEKIYFSKKIPITVKYIITGAPAKNINESANTTIEYIKAFNREMAAYEYIVVQSNGDIITKIKADSFKNYKILSPSEFKKYNGGICWDYCVYEDSKLSCKHKSFFFCLVDKDGNPKHTHTFILLYLDNKVYWFEASWKSHIGIFEFDNEDSALSYIIQSLSSEQKEKDFYIVEYKPAKYIDNTELEFITAMAELPEYNYKTIKNPKKTTIQSIKLDKNGKIAESAIDDNSTISEEILISAANTCIHFAQMCRMDAFEYCNVKELKSVTVDTNTGEFCFAIYTGDEQSLKSIISDYNRNNIFSHGTFKIFSRKNSYGVWLCGRITDLAKTSLKESANNNLIYLDIHKAINYLKQDKTITANYISSLKDYKGEVIINKDTGELVGRILVGDKKDKGFITDLYIKQKYRNQGLGTILLKDAINKFDGIDLTVKKTNTVAIDIYIKHGFVIVECENANKSEYYMKLKSKCSKDDKILKESVINESKDMSKLDSSFKKKTGVRFKIIDAASSEAKRYIKNRKDILYYLEKGKSGEIAIDTSANKIAGWIFVNKSGTIAPLFIYDEYRGYGLSDTLIKDAVNKYHGNNLGVYSDNEVAIHLYEKNGFKTYDQFTYKDGDTVYKMKLDTSKSNRLKESSSKIKLYHLSERKNLKILTPKVPNNFFTKNGYEDGKTPRVCFCPTINQCLMALNAKTPGQEFYVYIPDRIYSTHKATISQVPDSKITEETWITEVVKVRCIGKIKLVKDKGEDGLQFTYGDKTAELYEWDWEWIEKYYISEPYLEESTIQESIVYPGTILYHGSINKYDVLKCNGIDFGNKLQKPGFSLFCWTKKSYALGWSIFSLLKTLSKKYADITILGCKNSHIALIPHSVFINMGDILKKIPNSEKVYYVYTIKPDSSHKYGLGHSSNTPNCITMRGMNVNYEIVEKFTLTINDINTYCEEIADGYEPSQKDMGVNYRATSFLMSNDYMYNHKIRKEISKAIDRGELVEGDDIELYLKKNNITFYNPTLSDRLKESSFVNEKLESDWIIPECLYKSSKEYTTSLTESGHVLALLKSRSKFKDQVSAIINKTSNTLFSNPNDVLIMLRRELKIQKFYGRPECMNLLVYGVKDQITISFYACINSELYYISTWLKYTDNTHFKYFMLMNRTTTQLQLAPLLKKDKSTKTVFEILDYIARMHIYKIQIRPNTVTITSDIDKKYAEIIAKKYDNVKVIPGVLSNKLLISIEDSVNEYYNLQGGSETKSYYTREDNTLDSPNNITKNHIMEAFNSIIHYVKWCRMDDASFVHINLYNTPIINQDKSFIFATFTGSESDIMKIIRLINDNGLISSGRYECWSNLQNNIVYLYAKIIELKDAN